MSYLANFAKKHHIIIIATYLSHENSRRNSVLQEITTAKANTVLRFTKTPYTKEVELEKHPSYMLGVADLTSENQALTTLWVQIGWQRLFFNVMKNLKTKRKKRVLLFLLFGTQRTHCCACTPHFAVAHFFEFVCEFLAVVWCFALFKDYACFFACSYKFVE